MNHIKIRLVAVIAGLLVANSTWSADFEGQRFKLIDPYPGSEVVEFERDEDVTSRQVILGPLKKVNNALQPEASRFVRGSRTAITYRIRGERRTSVIQQFLKEQLVDEGEILFECEGRGCGSSNDWANAIFDRAILYGPEEFQHYILARMSGDETYYVGIYIARRGTGELYTHLDIIGTRTAEDVADVTAINAALRSRGKYILPWHVDEEMIVAVADALKEASTHHIAITGHDKTDAGEDVRDAMERTGERAAELRDQIISLGVDESRIESYGIGPLAPIDNRPRSRFELVLLDG
ncbi:MAG: DUF4892 domain-containing protein [Pseudomonadales bacterium]